MARRDDVPEGHRVNLTVRLARAGIARLRAEADRRGTTVSEVIRLAIQQGLPIIEKQDPPKPDAL